MIQQSRPQYWNEMVDEFDAIYTGVGRTRLGAMLDRWLRRDIYDRVAETVRLVSALGPRQRVLDVGCGTARLCVPLVAEGHSVVGVDFSEKMLAKAGQVLQHAHITPEQCRLLHGDMVNGIPAELRQYQSFDAIAMLGLLEYIENPVPMMQRLLEFSPKMIVASYCRAGTVRCTLRKLRYKVQGLDCPLWFQDEARVREIGREIGAKATEVSIKGQLFFTVYRF